MRAAKPFVRLWHVLGEIGVPDVPKNVRGYSKVTPGWRLGSSCRNVLAVVNIGAEGATNPKSKRRRDQRTWNLGRCCLVQWRV